MKYTIEEKYRKVKLQKVHDIGLICPICHICNAIQFVTHKDISKKDLEDFILGFKKQFYYTHILNCR